ncbi:MAG: hypothetical protein V1811_02650 [Candidatus Micrarchaeota archaeon]
MIEIQIPARELERERKPMERMFEIIEKTLRRKNLLYRAPSYPEDPKTMKNILEHGTDHPQRNWTWATHNPDYMQRTIDPDGDLYLVYDPNHLKLPKLEDWRKLDEPEELLEEGSDEEIRQVHENNLGDKEVHMFVNPKNRKAALLAIVKITYGT